MSVGKESNKLSSHSTLEKEHAKLSQYIIGHMVSGNGKEYRVENNISHISLTLFPHLLTQKYVSKWERK